jgi:hypothetical protein
MSNITIAISDLSQWFADWNFAGHPNAGAAQAAVERGFNRALQNGNHGHLPPETGWSAEARTILQPACHSQAATASQVENFAWMLERLYGHGVASM